MRRSPRLISPARARTSPESVFISVDLPEPFGPRIATTSPRRALKETSQRIW